MARRPLRNRTGQPIEQKAVAAPTATLLATQGLWLMFKLWPAARSVFPDATDQLQLVSLAATVFTGAAAYLAPHTPRPDLPLPKSVLPQPPRSAELA
jgi:hypothetical protein